MKKILLGMSLYLICFLSACVPYYWEHTFEKFTKWVSDDDLLIYDTQGEGNLLGYGSLLVNDERIDVLVEFAWVSPDLNIIDESGEIILLLSTTYKSNSHVALEVEFNKTGDSMYDNYSFNMYKTYLEDEELDAKKFLNTGFENLIYKIQFNYLKEARFTHTAKGSIEIDQEKIDLKLVFEDNYMFKIYQDNTDELVAEGTYLSFKNSVELVFDEIYSLIPYIDKLILFRTDLR